jgi:sortase A
VRPVQHRGVFGEGPTVPESNNEAMHQDPPAPNAPRRLVRGVANRLRRCTAWLPESGSDRALVLATLTAIMMVGGSTVAIMRSTPGPDRLALDAPTLVTSSDSSSTTTTLENTTTTVAAQAAAAPRTAPIAPPTNANAPSPIVQIGEIRIPKIGLVHPIFEGVTLTVIDHGPGHWPGSAMPGQLGNAVFAGHRVTHTHPMRRIDELVEGDDIIFATNDGVFTYKVTGHEIVTPKDVRIVTPTPNATVTIFGCHPPGQATHRYVVHGVFASSTPR